MAELEEKYKIQLDTNIKSMLANGASQQDVMNYANDYRAKYINNIPKTNQHPLDSTFSKLTSNAQELSKPFEPVTIENATKFVLNPNDLKIFGKQGKEEFILPKPVKSLNQKDATSNVFKPLFETNLKELGINEQSLNEDNPNAIFYQNRIAEKFYNDIESLQNKDVNEISDFINVKKQSLNRAKEADISRAYSKPVEETKASFRTTKNPNQDLASDLYSINTEYDKLNSELDNIAKAASFSNSPYLYKDLDVALSMPNQNLLKQLEQVGNNIENVTEDEKRATFQARANTGFGNVKYDQLYKDRLAYLGIQSEMNATYKEIGEINSVLSDKYNEIEELTNQLNKNPRDKNLISQIQQLSNEVNPLVDEVNKRKSFIQKLSDASFELPEFDKEYREQLLSDINDIARLNEFGGKYGRPLGLAIQGISNDITSTLKGAAIVGNNLSKLLGRNTEEATITESNLLLDNSLQFTVPTRLKEGKAIDVKFKDGETLPDININWGIVAPMAIQTTGEMLLMGGAAAPFARFGKLGQIGGLYLGSSLVFGGNILESELKKGLDLNEALAITGLRLGVEAATEMVNPLEFIPFNGVAKKFVGDTVSKSDFIKFIGNNWQGLFPKLKAMGVDVMSFLKNASKSMVLESFEEVMSDLGNYGINEYVVNNIKPDYQRDTDITLENELTTFLTTALTMAPMSIYQGIAETKAEKYAPGLRYKASQTPKLFLTNLKDNLDKGNISETFYNTAKAEIEKVSNLYNANKQSIDLADEDTRVEYLDAIYQHDTLSQELLNETDPVKKEKLIEEVKKSLQRVKLFDDEYTPLINNPVAQAAKKEEVYIDNLKTFASKSDIENASIEDLNVAKSIINDVISNPFSENVKVEAEKQLDKINKEIENKTVKQQEQQNQSKTIFEQESEKIQTLNKDKISSYKIPKEIKGEERKQLIQAKNEREKQLEDIENTISFEGKEGKQDIQKGQWVQIEGQNNVYKAKSFEEDRFTASFADDSQDISINPKDYKVTPISQEEAEKILNSKVSTSQEKKEEVISKNISSDIEAKKADIEKRRQEEFRNAGEQSKKESNSNAIANDLLQNSKVGDTITDKNGDGYEITEVRTRKDGTKEVILVPFELVEGEKDYNYSGTKLISETNKKAASDLYEFSYTNSNGERVTETYSYNTNSELVELNKESSIQEKITDIERRRQEELKPLPYDRVKKLIGKIKDNNQEKLIAAGNAIGKGNREGYQTVGIGEIKEKGFITKDNVIKAVYERWGEEEGDKFFKMLENEAGKSQWGDAEEIDIRDINIKYDAELAALEDTEIVITPTQEEANTILFKNNNIILNETGEYISEEHNSMLLNDNTSSLIFNLKNKIQAKYNRNTEKFDLVNSSNKLLESNNQILKYSKILSEKPNIIKTWWNDLISSNTKFEVVQYLIELRRILEKGIQLTDDVYLSDKDLLTTLIRGTKFKPFQIEKNVTDINKKKWLSDSGVSLDLFIKEYLQPELESNGFNLSQQDISNIVLEIISEYPNGISKKDIDLIIKDSNPAKELIAIQENFSKRFSLDIESVLYKLDKEDLINYENKIQRQSESNKNDSITESEDVEIIVAPTQEQVDLQAELDRIIEDNNQEVQKEVVKNQETKKPKYYPFSTRPIGIDIQDDIVGKVAQNSLRWLNNQIKSTGKSITDQGYFITVFDVNDSKLKPEWFPQRTQEYWKTNAKKGKVAVITDKGGNIKFFSENGEVSETGTWSMHWIPDLNTLNKPTFEGNNAEQRSKQWDLDKEKLSKLRDIKEPTIIEIERIISQPVKVLETPIKLIEAYNNPDSYTIKVQGLESSIVTPQGEFPIILSNKIDSIPNIAEDIYEFLNLNNSEGLPDAWKTNSKDKQERLKVFKSRLGFSLTPGTSNKTFPEIILLTSPSLRQFRLDADTNLPYIVDHLNKKEYRTKEEFIEFVNSQILNISNFINSQAKQSDVNLTIYRFKDGKFTTEQRPYKQLIADNFNVKVEQPIENPYIKFGKGVKKLKDEPVDKPVEQKPQLEQPQKVETKIAEDEFNFDDIAPAEDTLDDINDTEGLNRVKTLKQKVTTKQEAEAQTWFESYLAKSGATFNDSREIANSTAFANWKNGAITLWKSGKYTDLYHEAWHDFTQMFLTPEQKKALYNEAEKSEEGQKVIQGKETELEKFFALEEMLAEDFYKYQLSGQKLILGQRVKRNTIFRKVYNFLKELLTGKPSIERLYRQLANQNINIAKRDIANAMFGTLNKSIEGLSIKDSLNLYKAIDSMIASQIKNRSISISQIFLEKGYLNKTYGTVKNSLLESAKELAAQYKQNPTSELKYTLDNLSYTLRNWESVKESHRVNSKFLKVSKDLLLEEIDEEGNEVETNIEKYGDARDEANPIDNVSQYILYMIASLPDVRIVNGIKTDIKNQFLPNVTDTVDFGRAWGQLAKNLEGDKDYTSMYNKIDKLSKTQPSFKPLLSLLPNPNKDLNRYELQLKASFINALSKPLVNLKTTSIEYVGDTVKILSRNAEFITFKQLAQDWDLALQEIPNEYTNEDSETSQRSLNLDKILSDFKVIRKDNSKDFLSALGFTFSEATLSSPELQSILNIENRKLKDIYNALKSYKELQEGKYPNNLIPSDAQISSIKKPIFKPTEVLSRSIYVNKQPLFSSVKKVIDELLEIELNHSEKYHGDSVTNSEGNNQWLHKDWSLQSQDYSLLNNIEKFPTYQQLILDPLGKYFDIDLNPDANNIFINSLFVLDVPKTDKNYGQRRTKGKTFVNLELFEQNGLRISVGENLRDGLKTSRLPRFLALIADLPTLLTTGEKQHLRYGDKSTSRGTKTIYPSFVKNTIKNDIYLPVDISDFSNPDKISEQAWIILSNSLKSALQITNNQTANNQYQNVANLPLNIEKSPFGTFDKILSKETKELLRLAHSNEQVDINSLVNSYRFNIEKDIVEFFKNDTKVILNELNANPYITEKDYIPEKLLNNYPKEQLIRAFSMNSWIINTEHIRFSFQDQRYYDIKIGKKNQNYKEPFKRFSKNSSTGNIAINDYQTNNFFNSIDSGSFAEKVTYDKNNPDNPSKEYVEEGIVNSVIFKDVIYKPIDYAYSLLDKLKYAPNIEKEAVQNTLNELKVTDAMAVCTFDWYRNMKLRIGEEAWSDESEKLYQKIARGEQLTQEDELNSYLFFPPMKFRSPGRTFDEKSQSFVPTDYKYAITPLLGTVIKNKSYEIVKNNMIRQNIHLALFQSASKHSAITNNGKYNTFYEDGKPYTGDYTINPIPVEYFYEVVNSPDYYKEESRYSTQLRTILFVNLFDNGIPRDVDRYKIDWNSLSESEKKKISPSYKRAVDFRDSIDDIIRLRKEKLLNQIEASYNPETDSFTFNEVKLSSLLEREFDRKNQPFNVISSIQLQNGKFKSAFDATIARDEIENVILSIIDNKLRKQDVYGESLIQASSAGFETNIDEKLNFYKNNGRTKKDGTKVTSAHKIKISLQGDFKKLLQHPDVLDLSSKQNITPLQALNQLIKDENWLDKGNNRKFITTVGVRIPVQGLNSMEFMEVDEFLPTEAGSIVVVSPELVAKSGGDFDWDKITSYFPHLFIDSNGDIQFVERKSDAEIEELYDQIANPLKQEIKDILKTRKITEIESKEVQTIMSSNNLISSIFGESDIRQLIEDSFGRLKEDSPIEKLIPSKKQFVAQYKEKEAHNQMIDIMREILEDSNNFVNLVLPNATYMFEDIADERKTALQTEVPGYADNGTVRESLNQHESNFVGKDALGIGAIANKFFPLMQQVGMYLNNEYVTNLTFRTAKYTRNRFPHNEINIDGTKHISVSGVYSVEKGKGNKYKISEAISQLMNGWVDVAKKDWIFYINGRKELAPTMLFHLIQGTHKDDVISFFNQPVLYDYIKELNNLKNPLIRLKDRELYNSAKKNAIYNVLMKYIPDSQTISVKRGKKIITVNLKEELTSKFEGKSEFFYSFVNNQLRGLADNHPEFFNDEKFNYHEFAIPQDGKLKTPKTDKEKLAQALYLIQYLELEEQTNLFSQMRKTLNNDTSKASSFQYSKARKAERDNTLIHGLFPDNLVDKLVNQSVLAGFTNDSTGLDTFIQQFSKNMFELTNHPIFNSFLFREWSKPELSQFDNQSGQMTVQGNNIPFENRGQDDFSKWVRTLKNDFILYIYANSIYDENDIRVSNKVFRQLQYPTALAHDLEQLKRDFPNLVKNNMFLQYLVKDNSTKLNSQNKPNLVNIKLKYSKLDKDNSDIITQDFSNLLNFNDGNYTIDEQLRIQTFAKSLADFAYIQSGLNNTPVSFAKYIPQDVYARDMQDVIVAFKEVFDNNPKEANKIVNQFYNLFRINNSSFYIPQEDEYGNKDIVFAKETFRFKDYRDYKFYDILNKKLNKSIEQAKKKTSTLPNYKVGLAQENPKTLFVFEDSLDNKITGNSANITLVQKGKGFSRPTEFNKPENTQGITLLESKDKPLEDKFYNQNESLIEQNIRQILQLTESYDKVVFPDNLFDNSKLKENSPKLYNLTANLLNEYFGLSLELVEDVIFETNSELSQRDVLDKNIENFVNNLIPGHIKNDNDRIRFAAEITSTIMFSRMKDRLFTAEEIYEQVKGTINEIKSKSYIQLKSEYNSVDALDQLAFRAIEEELSSQGLSEEDIYNNLFGRVENNQGEEVKGCDSPF